MASTSSALLFVSAVAIFLAFSVEARPKVADVEEQLGESIPVDAMDDGEVYYDADEGYALAPAYRVQRRGFLHSGRLGKRGFLVSSRLGKRGFLHSFRLGK